MKMDTLKENMGSFWDNLTEGWKHLTQYASGALTRFRADDQTQLPAASEIDDPTFLPTRSWAVIGGDLFEDERRLVLRLEVPGVQKSDISIEILGDTILVSGEKRFEREATEGRWRVMQCAYGAFRRSVPLPVPVAADQALASYRDGVLRIELPKAHPGKPKAVRIAVQ